jgi:hypothetical protein
LQTDQLGLSGEYVRRFQGRSAQSYRLLGIVECEFGKEAYLTATFGKNFDTGGQGDLVSILGVNIGLGKEPKLSLR